MTPGPLRALFLDLPLDDARADPDLSADLRWWLANSWSVPTALERSGQVALVQLDEQQDGLSLAVRLPWGRLLPGSALAARLTTVAGARVVRHWGGWTDRPIEAWHVLMGFDRFDRWEYPRDAVAVRLGTLVDLRGPATAVGDLTLRTALRVAEGEGAAGPWAFAVRLDVKLPAGRPSDLSGSGGWDAGAGLGASGPLLGPLTGHAMLSARAVSRLPAASPLQPRPLQLAAEASLALRLGGGWALLLEDRLLSALFERGWRLAVAPPEQGDAVMAVTRPLNQVTGGVRWGRATLWLSEDFTYGHRAGAGASWFYDSNAPDLVVGLSVVVGP
ncbi:MAG TPA: hypothetical protein VFP50_06910 [Anaeromyxobacteraceae bacterium]|nr:hypothetical protein [Anaeromyxobacteraceae bacterium]